MTTAPKVSVIIPAYCAADHLHVAIDSLRAQTLTDFEAIIVEDRSPDQDATLHAAEDIAASDSRFRVARTPVNSGGGPARNVGIELARGEYIATLDADDSLAPDALENLYCIAKLHNADQVCYAMEHHYATGYVTGHSEDATETVYTDPHEIKELALCNFSPSYEPGRRQYPQFTGCSRLYRRSLLIEHNVRFPTQHHFLSEDMAFIYESMRHVRTVVALNNSYYRYTMRESSVTHTPREDMIERSVEAAEYFVDMVRRDPDAPAVGVHNAWGYAIGAVRAYLKVMFVSPRSLRFKRRWMRRQADLPLFRTIYEQYPWRRMPRRHRLGFIAFYRKRFWLLYTLIVGQEKVRRLLRHR